MGEGVLILGINIAKFHAVPFHAEFSLNAILLISFNRQDTPFPSDLVQSPPMSIATYLAFCFASLAFQQARISGACFNKSSSVTWSSIESMTLSKVEMWLASSLSSRSLW
jgi:hypothetical protein